jgi:hypothetical protein
MSNEIRKQKQIELDARCPFSAREEWEHRAVICMGARRN